MGLLVAAASLLGRVEAVTEDQKETSSEWWIIVLITAAIAILVSYPVFKPPPYQALAPRIKARRFWLLLPFHPWARGLHYQPVGGKKAI